MKKELRNYLEYTIFQSELSINESWIDTIFRWIQGNKYSLIEGTDFGEFKEVCEEIRDSMILSKEEFIKKAQGEFQNDDKNLWVEVDGVVGDGTTRVAVFKKDDDVFGGLIEWMMDRKHGPTLSGKFNIYSYDCDNPAVDEPCKTLDGKYFTYYYDGFIAFVEY